ncbi:MAG: hypothetical protein FJZ63_07245, partial [Chlamydiae bacterium]|nr:hypothetical protein [Chlamydiota bacterium]
MSILRQLGLEAEPVSLPQLMQQLGSRFKERSVRRWLSLLIQEGVVYKIGHKRGTRYAAASRLGEDNSEVSSCFSSASLKAIKEVRRPLFERLPIAYVERWLEDYRPNVSYYLDKGLRKRLLESG